MQLCMIFTLGGHARRRDTAREQVSSLPSSPQHPPPLDGAITIVGLSEPRTEASVSGLLISC
eukprot:2620226-Pleurochrysis_carterae.AAC.6